jgi:hypothetical protein
MTPDELTGETTSRPLQPIKQVAVFSGAGHGRLPALATSKLKTLSAPGGLHHARSLRLGEHVRGGDVPSQLDPAEPWPGYGSKAV